MLSEADRNDLLQFGASITGAMHSPWEPRTVVRAFATPRAGDIVFTMQHWIDLQAVKSEVLLGVLPARDEELAEVFAIFGLPFFAEDGKTPVAPLEELDLVAESIQRAVADGFAAALAMRPPSEESGDTSGDLGGFGEISVILAFLTVHAGFSLAEALALRVSAAFVLMAAARRNQGWLVAGTPYALRNLPKGKEAASA